MFPLLSRASAYAVGLELTNHIMAFLSAGFTGNTDHCTVFFESFSLSEKEMDIVAYLSGYVFSTFSRRLRRSKHWTSEQSQLKLSILLAGKTDANHSHQKLVSIRNRGGLWHVRDEVVKLFSIVENYFKVYCNSSRLFRSFDTKSMVAELLSHPEILSNYHVNCKDAEHEIDGGFALNLLKDLLTLYLRVRSFSYAKDKVQQHKLESKSSKRRSLRTEIKKTTSTLDQGH